MHVIVCHTMSCLTYDLPRLKVTIWSTLDQDLDVDTQAMTWEAIVV